jgi:oligopeptidase B
MTWANDSQTLFFAELDDTHRPWRLRRHTLGDAAQTVFEEPDGRFFLHCYRTSSERQLVLLLNSKTTSEAWVLDAATRRRRSPAWRHGSKATNTSPTTASSTASGAGSSAATRTASTSPCTTPGRPVPSRDWQVLVAHRDDGDARRPQPECRRPDPEPARRRPADHRSAPAGPAGLPRRTAGRRLQPVRAGQPGVRQHRIRLRYEALNRPAQVRQLELATGAQVVLKQTPVLGAFDADDYVSQRLWATAGRHPGADQPGAPPRDLGKTVPLYLYGYGAYGESLDPWFSHARLSLLERGVAFAIAHVRGGGELGEAWYRAGKQEHKHNTFSDFIACAEHLIARA